MKFITFAPNQPQSFVFPVSGPYTLPNNVGSLYPLSEGEWLYLGPSQAESAAILKLMPGEEFGICLYYDGKVGEIPRWNVWLMPSTEKARARAEVAHLDIEAQLNASLKLEQRRKGVSSGEALPDFCLTPTGTEGGAASPLPSRKVPALAVAPVRRKAAGSIPMDQAFREIVAFVVKGLADAGEQWSDQSKQDMCSTALIAAQKAGLLTVWEREDAA